MPTLPLGDGTEDGFTRLVDWCYALIDEQIGIQGHSETSGQFSLKLKEGPEVILRRESPSGTCYADSTEELSPLLQSILKDASARTTRGDIGQPHWWRTSFASHHMVDAAFGLQMLRMLGQRRAYTGRWRLGEDVLLDFEVQDPKELAAFTKQTITVTFRSHGPGHGPRAARGARVQSDLVRAVLAFCTATTLQGPPIARPVKEPEFPAGAIINSSFPELSVQGISPWSRLSEAISGGAADFVSRVVNALTAYEHALHQPTSDAATVFYVAAIEALTVPNHRYSHQRVTSRFEKSLLLLASPKLEETLLHGNFDEAFGQCKTIKQLAQRIYALRSTPVHTGQFGLSRNSFFSASSGGSARAALLAEIAEAAILEFLNCPFTSLIGHMEFDPACRIELTESEHALVQAAARERGLTIEDYILQSIGLSPRQ